MKKIKRLRGEKEVFVSFGRCIHSKATNISDFYLLHLLILFPATGLLNSFNFTDFIIIALSIFIDETHKYV